MANNSGGCFFATLVDARDATNEQESFNANDIAKLIGAIWQLAQARQSC